MQVSMIVASTLDGFIAQESDQNSTKWTSQADFKWFGEISRECGTMIMGRTTFATIGKALPGRVSIVLTHQKLEGIPDLEEMINDVTEGVFTTALEPAELLKKLQELGKKRVAICGGASIYAQFLELDLIDDIYMTIEPILFGAGVKLLSKKLYKKLTLIEVKMISDQTNVFHLLTGAAETATVVMA